MLAPTSNAGRPPRRRGEESAGADDERAGADDDANRRGRDTPAYFAGAVCLLLLRMFQVRTCRAVIGCYF